MSTEAKSPAGRLPRAWSVLQRSSFALALLLVALAFFRASNAPIWHLDTWGHWKYGEWIWQNGRLPEHEPFSDFSEKDRPLVDTLWLSQVLGYLAYARGGAEGVALFYGLVEAVRVGLYLAAYRRVSGSLPLACAGVVLMEACRWTYFGVFRPQTMGEVFWAATLLACAPALGPGQPVSRWAVLWLPPCFAVWANLHGAFPLGLIVLGVTLAGLLWGRFWSGLRPVVSLADLGTRRLALMLGLSALAACANPYGPKLLIEVARFGQNPVLQLVSEWHPTPPLTTYASKMFIASLVLVLLTARFSPRRFSFGDVTLLLLFGVSAWFAARMLPWWTAVWPLVLLPHWAAIAERLAGGTSVTPHPSPAPRWAVIAGAAAALLVVLASDTGCWLLTGRPRPPEAQVTNETPVEATARLKEWLAHEAPADRPVQVFGIVPWDDYLLWELPPSAHLYYYSHWHCFGPQRLIDANRLELLLGPPNSWRDVLERGRFDVLALRRDRSGPLFDYLLAQDGRADAEWRIIYKGPARGGRRSWSAGRVLDGLWRAVFGKPQPPAGAEPTELVAVRRAGK